MLPSLSVEVSVKLTVSPLAEELKLATGATLPPPPPAASTAALASAMPAPISCGGVDGNGRAALFSNAAACAGVFGVAETACIKATTPATCGVAIEVPL